MRRVLLAVLLVLASATVPAAGAPREDGLVPLRVPGRIHIGHATGEDWLQHQYEAIAGMSDIAADVLKRFDRAVAHAGEEYDIYGAYAIPDLTGDRVPDLLYLRAKFTMEQWGPDGSSTISLLSGRAGAQVWTRRLSDIPLPGLAVVPVGSAGRLGLVIADAHRPSLDEYVLRFVGLDGRKGKTVYDKSFSSSDGKGEVQFGGLFDAVVGGGKDILVGRVNPLLGLQLVLDQSIIESSPYVVDGSNGTVRQAHETTIDVAADITFVATGDLDGDGRDEILALRRELGDEGSVIAYSTVENETLWTTPDIPIGWAVLQSASANITGDRKDDVLLTTWTFRPGLLEVPPYTDGLPLLDGPADGMHGVLLDGPTGKLRWDRLEQTPGSSSSFAFYEPWTDVDGDKKADVLVMAGMHGERDGWRLRLITGANKVLYTRDITVLAPPARRSSYASMSWAGYLDGDRVPDLGFRVVSSSPVESRVTEGLLLVKSNKRVNTSDVPLGGTLDGGSYDRFRVEVKKSTARVTFLDGYRGGAYWSMLYQNRKDVGWFLELRPGARGRCDGVIAHGFTEKGAYWIDVLDGGTGQVKWSKTFVGPRPAVGSRAEVSGRRARCR